MKRYKPDQSDRDAFAIARLQGVRIFKLMDGEWAWELNGVGVPGFETKWHAARDSLVGLVTLNQDTGETGKAPNHLMPT
jgi:hypothetical protein